MKNILFCLIPLFLASCGGSDSTQTSTESSKPVAINAQEIYKAKCKVCHGDDGRLGIGGAKSLPESKLSADSIQHQIRKGKRAMPAFENQLSEAEIVALSEYVVAMKGK